MVFLTLSAGLFFFYIVKIKSNGNSINQSNGNLIKSINQQSNNPYLGLCLESGFCQLKVFLYGSLNLFALFPDEWHCASKLFVILPHHLNKTRLTKIGSILQEIFNGCKDMFLVLFQCQYAILEGFLHSERYGWSKSFNSLIKCTFATSCASLIFLTWSLRSSKRDESFLLALLNLASLY